MDPTTEIRIIVVLRNDYRNRNDPKNFTLTLAIFWRFAKKNDDL